MTDFEKTLNESLEDTEFKKEWKNSEVEYQIMKMIGMARCEKNLTQQELSNLSGGEKSSPESVSSFV
jgi:hypothetical protein